MPAEAHKGPRGPEPSKKSSGPSGPTAYKGPMVAPEVLADAKHLQGQVREDPVSQQRTTVVDMTRPALAAPSRRPEGPRPETSPSPRFDSGIWEEWPQKRFEPNDPLYQLVLMRNRETGEFKERLVGPDIPEDYPLLPVDLPMPEVVSKARSVAGKAATAAATTPTSTTPPPQK